MSECEHCSCYLEIDGKCCHCYKAGLTSYDLRTDIPQPEVAIDYPKNFQI